MPSPDPLAGVTSPLDQAQPAPSASGAPDPLAGITSPLDAAAPTAPAQTFVSSLPQDTSLMRWPKLIGTAAIKGADFALGLPGEGQRLVNRGMNHLWAALGLPEQDVNATGPLEPTVDKLVAATDKLGLTNRSDLFGASPTERGISTAVTGATAGLLTAPLLGPEGATIPSTVGAGTGGAINALFPNDPLAGAFAGAIGGAGAATAAELAERGINASRGALNSNAQDFVTAGLPVRSAALTTENPATARALAPHAPVAQTQQDLGAAVEAHAAHLGQSRTLQDAGEAAQTDTRRYLAPLPQDPALRAAEIANPTTLDGKVAKVWAPVDGAVPPSTVTPLSNMRAALEDMTKSGGSLQPLISELSPKLPQRLLEKLTGPEDLVGAALPPTWAEVQQLRSALGDAMKNPQVVKDMTAEQISRLYAATTADMRETTLALDSAGGGGRATSLFDSANAESSRLYTQAERTLSKIVSGATKSSDDPLPEKVAASLLSGGKAGGTDLAVLRSELPNTADELAAVHLRQTGLDDPSDPTSSVAKGFAGKWATLSPEAKAALVADPQQRAALDASARIAGRLKPMGKPQSGMEKGVETVAGLGLGGAAGSLIAQAVHHWFPELIDAGLPGLGEGAAVGEMLGVAGPAVRRYINSRVANNALLAHLAGARGTAISPRWGAVAGAAGAAANDLGAVQKAQEQNQ